MSSDFSKSIMVIKTYEQSKLAAGIQAQSSSTIDPNLKTSEGDEERQCQVCPRCASPSEELVQKYLPLTSGPASIQFRAFLPSNTPYTPLRLDCWVSAGRATYPLLSPTDETGYSLLKTRNYNPLIFHYLGEAMARKDRLFGKGIGKREGELSLEEVVEVVRRCDELVEGYEGKVRREREEAARAFMEVVRMGELRET